MKKAVFSMCGIIIALALTGCGVRSIHRQEFERVDQKISGNRGYLKGTPPPAEDRTGIKRELMAVDIDLGMEERGPYKPAEKAEESKSAAPARLEDTSDIK